MIVLGAAGAIVLVERVAEPPKPNPLLDGWFVLEDKPVENRPAEGVVV